MANYKVTDIELTNIANAIRTKRSTSSTLSWPNEYINAINDIQTEAYAAITVTYPSGSTCTCTKENIIITASDTNGQYIFLVPENGIWTVSCTDGIDSTNKDVTISNQYQVVDIKLYYLPELGITLNDCSWKDISKVAKAGIGDTYWDIGDRKQIILNGAIGSKLTLNTFSLCVFILDFNHPINKTIPDNNIIFGGFKMSLTDSKDIALCTPMYGNYGSGTSGDFLINFYTNQDGNTFGGWKACDLRYYILGATKTQPDRYGLLKNTSVKGYDGTQEAINSPNSNSLMAALPSDFRSVLRLWDRYIDCFGFGCGSVDAHCSTPTIDAGISLLSSYEVFASVGYKGNTYEAEHQKQMQYYINGNSKKRYSHANGRTGVMWWTATPSVSTGPIFWSGVSGTATSFWTNSCATRQALAPAFKV